MGLRVLQVDSVLEYLPGSDWSSRHPLPHYDYLAHTSSRDYEDQLWSWPARYAWLSINHHGPSVAVMEALAARTPNAWAWQPGLDERFQPAVWAGAAMVRDTRIKAAAGMVEILSQALEGVQTSSERVDRVAAILGGGWHHAATLLGHWQGAGWRASRTWGEPMVELLSLVNQSPQQRQENALWLRWNQVISRVAQTPEEAARMRDRTFARALRAWEPFVRIGRDRDKYPGQETFEQRTLAKIPALNARSDIPPKWSASVHRVLERLLLVILETEATRGPVGIQAHNIDIMGVAIHGLLDTRPRPSFIKKVSTLLHDLPVPRNAAQHNSLSLLRRYALTGLAQTAHTPQEPKPISRALRM